MPIYSPELERQYNSVEPLRTYFRLLGASPWEHARLFLLFLIKAAPQLILPVVITVTVGAAIAYHNGTFDDAWGYLMLIFGMFAIALVANIPFHVWFVRGSSRVTRTMELRLRAALVRRLQQLSMHFHGERETGRLQSKVLRDVDELVRLGDLYFHMAMGAALSIIFAFAITLWEDPKVSLFYLVATPVAVVLIRVFRSSMSKRNDALRMDFEGMSQRVSEMIDMVPVTRAHGVEHTELASVQDHLNLVRERGYKVDSINAFFGSSAFVVFYTTVLLMIIVVTWLVFNTGMAPEKIVLYASLFQQVVGSVQGLLNMMPQVSKSLSSIRSIGEILECPDLEENEGKIKVDHVEGFIDFRNITFHYSGQERPAVADFSLNVRPGTCVAFVGESGSGKSTLMQLAIGFLRPQEGQILLDGKPMETIDMRTWRRHIAMVPQHTILFSGSIRDNITYGLDQFQEADVQRAVEVANLQSVIAELPEGLDTRVGENGLKLSGGQRQRLAIARAVIRDPRVIILDEATSALDVISEREVQVAIENLIEGRTTFVVAHRLSTIRQANLIVVMRNGHAIEVGTPEALQAAQGAYSELRSLQAS